jgi:mono/diheme cytochrome c family protein
MKSTVKKKRLSATLVVLSATALTAAAFSSTAGFKVEGASAERSVEDEFETNVRPVLEKYCSGCHGEAKQKADIRFDEVNPDMIGGPDAEIWHATRDMLNAGDMPPSKAPQPTTEERRALLSWLDSSLEEAARASESERAPVLRRLNKAQYTNSLQELLGLSIDFGQVLPDDGKSKMGFSNNGEVLLSSPLHLEYYQEIARVGLDQAIVIGERAEPIRYKLSFGRGLGVGKPAGTTGGYQAIPLNANDFVVDILDVDGTPKVGADSAAQMELDRIKRKVTVGFRGSSQERFHTVEEGLVLYSALPHKEVAPGSWQGPSPNMKLEMQRVFPDEGDFALRVTASHGYLVKEKKELLVSIVDPTPRASLTFSGAAVETSEAQALMMASTDIGPMYRAGPISTATGEIARDTVYVDPASSFDFDALLSDGVTGWKETGDEEGVVKTYPIGVGTVHLARIIEAPSARTMDISIGSDDAVWIWLNGESVLKRDVRRGVAADQDLISLSLKAGRNELLIKVVNYLGSFGSYHRVIHDGTTAGATPYELVLEDATQVLNADRSDQRKNLIFRAGGLVPEDSTKESGARLFVDLPRAGYYQFDLVHVAMQPAAMGSIRFKVGGQKLDLRPQLSEVEVERGFVVTTVGGGYMNKGRHEVTVGGPIFVGFSHVLITPLGEDHPLVMRLEANPEEEAQTELPAMRAFIGTRTDDGMDYKTFDGPQEVTAKKGSAEIHTFYGRLENLPIPEPDSGDLEVLSGILVLGVWNDHLVKSNKETGPPLLIEAMEFEAPYHPVWPPLSHTQIFFESSNSGDELLYTREVLTRFLERAFRRPAELGEVARYMEFWSALRDDYEHYEHSVREVLVAVLSSPSFLFMVEPESAADSISEEALASRLSFFLWNSPPDEELRELAKSGELRLKLHEQAARLLDDPRSDNFVRAFTKEWLRIDRLEGMTINPNKFRDFTRFVKRDMAEETYQFVSHVLREDLNLFTLIDSDFAMLNQNLAEFYGVEGVEGVAFRPVPVAPEQGRGGLLSHGAFLAGHSDGNEPHPIKRAVWVKEKLLGQPPLPPPPNVPDLDPATPGFDKLTLKEQIELHRDSDSCRDCHASFDPYGIALESYSAVGLLESKRKGREIDASTVLPDGTLIDGPEGLRAYILEEVPDSFASSLIEHLFAYALGRDVGYADEEELQNILKAVRSKGDRMRAVIHEIVSSPSFRER